MEFMSPLFGPVIALALWTLVMLIWAIVMVQKGIRSGADLGAPPKGARGRDLDGRLDPKYLWARQNYEHLVEQPTLFYAIVIVLALMGQTHFVNLLFAWGYVALRIVHSIMQATGRSRGATFVASTLLLLGLVVHAAIAWVHHL